MRHLLGLVLLCGGCLDQFGSPSPAPAETPDLAGPASMTPPSDLATAPSTSPSMAPAGSDMATAAPSTTPTDVSGSLAADTTWSGAYHLTADVTVAAGKTLTVAAGSTITVAPAATLFVDGTLAVTGSAASPVLFTQAGTTEWKGLDVRTGGKLQLSNATVEHVTYGVVCETGATQCQADHAVFQHFSGNGVLLKASATFDHIRVEFGGSDGFYCDTDGITATVTNSTFHQTGGDAVWMDKGNLDFENNAVYGNTVGGFTPDQHCAIHLAGTGTFTLKKNDFYRSVYGFMASVMGAASVVTGNNFYENGTMWGASTTDSNLNPVGINAAVQLGGNYWGGTAPSIVGNATVNPATPSTFSATKLTGTGPQ